MAQKCDIIFSSLLFHGGGGGRDDERNGDALNICPAYQEKRCSLLDHLEIE